MIRFEVHPELSQARQPPPELYTDPAVHERLRERVLARGWSLLAHIDELAPGARAWPLTLLPGSLDEPVLLTAGADGEGGPNAAWVNACTHRGHLLAQAPESGRSLRCPYHGRRFDLGGRCLGQPFLDGVEGFPGPDDHLPPLPYKRWGPLLFGSVDPLCPLEELLAPLEERLGFLPLDRARLDPAGCRDYAVDASWLLYVDNYLEGLHLPFVHPGLNRVLDLGTYSHVLLPWGTLQLGAVGEGEPAFELPEGHPEAGQRIGAFYFYVFPTLMVNAYPWGLSLNLLQPQGVGRTRIRYLTLTWEPALRGQGAGGDLDTVELEDEAVVEAVARGLRSRRARTGRYVPGHEQGLHHVHRLLARLLAT